MKSKKGFTLTELLAVIVILGILTSLAILGYNSYISSTRKKAFEIAENSMKEAAEGMYVDCGISPQANFLCNIYQPPEPDESRIVTLQDLIEGGYIRPISDPYKENDYCDATKSYVLTYGQEPVEGSDNINLTYKSCLYCSRYQTEGCEFDLDPGKDFNININMKLENSSGSAYHSEWTDKNIWIEITSGDPYQFGIKRIEYATNDQENWTTYNGPITWSTEGVTKLQVRAIDNADNMSQVENTYLKIDRTEPTATITAKKANGDSIASGEWSSSAVTMTANTNNVPSGVTYQWQECATADNNSCYNMTNASEQNYTADIEGEKRYRVMVTTGSGISSFSEQFIVRIDKKDYSVQVSGGIGGSITLKNESQNKEITVASNEQPRTMAVKLDDKLTVKTTTNDGYMGPTITKDGAPIENNSSFTTGQKNSTITASWEYAIFNVTYNYQQNGGSSVTKPNAQVAYQTNVDLSVTASKNGYEFVGWNTDPNATTGLSSYQMPANDVTLYAIYRKVITITYIDTTTRTNSCTVYNNTSNCNITLYGVNGKSGYNVSGWRTDTQAAAATYGSSSTQTFSNSTTLYAIWSKTVHLYSYDGSTLVKDSAGTVYSSASGNHSSFTASFGPSRSLAGYVFKGYRINGTGTVYGANATYSIQDNVNAYVYWEQTTVTLSVNCHVGGSLTSADYQPSNYRDAVCYNSYDITNFRTAVFTFHATGHYLPVPGFYGNVFFYAYVGNNNNRVLLTSSGDYPSSTLTVNLSNKSTSAQFKIRQWNDAHAGPEYYNTMYVDKIVLNR